jgi:hypothetical protein
LVSGRVINDDGAVYLEVSKIEVLGVKTTGQEPAASLGDADALRYTEYMS